MKNAPPSLTEGSQTKAILSLAIPFLMANAVNLIVLLADRIWIGILGTTYLAAVGMAHAALVICITTIMSPGIGTLTGVAKSTGAQDQLGVNAYVRNGFLIGIGTGLLFGVGGFLLPDMVMSIMSKDAETSQAVIGAAHSYLQISLFGLCVQAPLYVLTFALQGAGRAKEAFRLQSVAPVVNLILDPILIFGPQDGMPSWLPTLGLGLDGAALASVIGYGVAFAIALFYVPTVLNVSLGLSKLSAVSAKVWRIILGIGLPGTVEQLVRSAAILLLVKILSPFGSAVLAAYTASIMVIMFLIFPGLALGQATATLVGQNLGADKSLRAYETALKSMAIYFTFMVVASIFIYLFAEGLISVFDRNIDVIREGSTILRRYCYCFPLIAFAIIVSKVFAGSGKTLPPMLTSMISHLVIQIPLAWWWSQESGPSGAYWAMVAAFWMHGSLNMLVFFGWKRKFVDKNREQSVAS